MVLLSKAVVLSRQEVANALTHAFGAILSVAAATILLQRVSIQSNWALAAASGVYAISLISLYFCSTMSHVLDSRGRRVFRALDQAIIYIFIVATYTPISIMFLRDVWSWCVLGLMWLLAIAGFVSKLHFSHRVDSVSIWLYLVLGWLPALAGVLFFVETIPAGCVLGLFAGGILYSLGTVFLYHDRRHWYFHCVWHLFVIAGSAVHFLTILIFVT